MQTSRTPASGSIFPQREDFAWCTPGSYATADVCEEGYSGASPGKSGVLATPIRSSCAVDMTGRDEEVVDFVMFVREE